MNNKKTLTSLAAASMVITQAGQMSVFAKVLQQIQKLQLKKKKQKLKKHRKNY